VKTKLFFFAGVVALALFAVACKPNTSNSVSGTIEVDESRVAPRTSGRITKLFVQEGDALTNGQPIVELEAPELHARRATIAAQLAELETGPRKEDIATAKAEWEAQVAQLELARIESKRSEELFTQNATSATDRDRAVSAAQTLEKSSTAAKSRYDLLLAGTRVEQLDAARAQLAEVDSQLRELTVFSPTNCVLETLSVKVGDVVEPNREVATVLFTSHLWVRVYVPETWLGRVKLGDTANIRVDAFPGRDFKGVIEQIARTAEFTPRNVQTVEERVKQVFGVKIRLDNKEGDLRAGMAADATFGGGK